MPKNPRSPTCSKCGKPMHFMLVKTGGRKFRCIDCEVPDALRLLLTSEKAHKRKYIQRQRPDQIQRDTPKRLAEQQPA
jgi:hypothetical protein